MCGIVGYIGGKEVVGVLENGLTRLEYRGYDSAGVAVMNGSGIKLRRAVGKLDALKKSLHDAPIHGHTGIIENYGESRAQLQEKGVTFRAQTDSEVLPNLIKLAFEEIEIENGAARLAEAVRQACARVASTRAGNGK